CCLHTRDKREKIRGLRHGSRAAEVQLVQLENLLVVGWIVFCESVDESLHIALGDAADLRRVDDALCSPLIGKQLRMCSGKLLQLLGSQLQSVLQGRGLLECIAAQDFGSSPAAP